MKNPLAKGVLALLCLGCASCAPVEPRGSHREVTPENHAAEEYNPPPGPRVIHPAPAQPPSPPPAAVAPGGRSTIAWPESLAWKPWDVASREARSRHRPILLVVYAEWCPHCHELAPMFQDPEVARMAARMEVVRQDADQAAPWLAEAVGRYGQYVPRVFFFRPDGTLQPDITSGNPRFPYFYIPQDVGALRTAMHRALASSPG